MCYAVDMTLHGNHSDSDSDSDREQREWVSISNKEELRGCDMEDESHSSAQWIPALVQDKPCLPFLLS